MTLTKLTDEIWVGDLRPIEDIKAHGIATTICLTSNKDFDGERIHYPLEDGAGNIPADFYIICTIIDTLVLTGRTPVLVQCRMGISRSVTVCAFYLAVKQPDKFLNIIEAVNYIKTLHKSAFPDINLLQTAQEALNIYRYFHMERNPLPKIPITFTKGLGMIYPVVT